MDGCWLFSGKIVVKEGTNCCGSCQSQGNDMDLLGLNLMRKSTNKEREKEKRSSKNEKYKADTDLAKTSKTQNQQHTRL
ncbi:unnamed protein product [Trifolium pratense]|uniref:Uncharacterized protein n=1 Tax=Trifolium pratense TaxID=57577 RepID=A0ACB0LYT6_TRIPR|nr:unnamed protein product [Trifolium pratense]